MKIEDSHRSSKKTVEDRGETEYTSGSKGLESDSKLVCSENPRSTRPCTRRLDSNESVNELSKMVVLRRDLYATDRIL
jgi:hypothetical protein